MKNKTILFILGLFYVNLLSASPIITPITQADIDALDSADIIWNAQFFPNSGNRQFSIGPGLDGISYSGVTTWKLSPETNPFFVEINELSYLTSGVDADSVPVTNEFAVTESYNEVWIFIRADVDFPQPSDLLAISNLEIEGEPLPTQNVIGGTGFSGLKVRFDDFPANLGAFNLTGNIEQQFGGAIAKDWNVNVIGVTAIPEPSSLVLLLVASVAVCGILRRR